MKTPLLILLACLCATPLLAQPGSGSGGYGSVGPGGGGGGPTNGQTAAQVAGLIDSTNNAVIQPHINSASNSIVLGLPTITITNGSSTATIQAAFNSLTSGGAISFQPGNYTITASISITNPMVIQGNGAKCSYDASLTNYMFDTGTNYAKALVLQGLWLDGGVLEPYNDKSYFFGTNDHRPYLMPYWTNRTGIRAEGSGGVLIQNCKFTGWSGNGALLLNKFNVNAKTAPRVVFRNNICATNFIGVMVPGVNYHTPGYYNAGSDAWNELEAEYSQILDNQCWGNQIGIYPEAGNCVVTGNEVNSNYVGIAFCSGSNEGHGDYSHNSLNHNIYPLFIDGFGVGVDAGSYVGNMIYGCSAVIFRTAGNVRFSMNQIQNTGLIFTNNSIGEVSHNTWGQGSATGTWGADVTTNFDSGMLVFDNWNANATNNDGSMLSKVIQSNGLGLTNLVTAPSAGHTNIVMENSSGALIPYDLASLLGVITGQTPWLGEENANTNSLVSLSSVTFVYLDDSQKWSLIPTTYGTLLTSATTNGGIGSAGGLQTDFGLFNNAVIVTNNGVASVITTNSITSPTITSPNFVGNGAGLTNVPGGTSLSSNGYPGQTYVLNSNNVIVVTNFDAATGFPAGTNVLCVESDSIFAGTGAADGKDIIYGLTNFYLPANFKYGTNAGVSGKTVATMDSEIASILTPWGNHGATNLYWLVEGGINDIALPNNADASTTYTHVDNVYKAIHASNGIVVAVMINSSTALFGNEADELRKYNSLILNSPDWDYCVQLSVSLPNPPDDTLYNGGTHYFSNTNAAYYVAQTLKHARRSTIPVYVATGPRPGMVSGSATLFSGGNGPGVDSVFAGFGNVPILFLGKFGVELFSIYPNPSDGTVSFGYTGSGSIWNGAPDVFLRYTNGTVQFPKGVGSLATNATVVVGGAGITNTLSLSYRIFGFTGTSVTQSNITAATSFSRGTITSPTDIILQPNEALRGSSCAAQGVQAF